MDDKILTRPNQQNENFKFVTALRGIAALMVASMHLFAFPNSGGEKVNLLVRAFLFPTRFGQFAVFLFLALSGYSLLRSERFRNRVQGKKTKFKTYMKRRIWRITPVYYFAVLFGTIATFALRDRIQLPNTPNLTPSGIISHLLYLHSLNGQWLMQANPALWTIAAEMQCYLLLPILIRFKSFKALSLATLITYASLHLFLHYTNIGLFSLLPYFLMGIIIGQFSLNYKVPNKYLYIALIPTGYFTLTRNFDKTGRASELLSDALFFTTLFLLCENLEKSEKFTFPNWLMKIGKGSYSLYACHYPLAYFTYWIASQITNSYALQLAYMGLIGIPLILIVTYYIYKFIELPSLTKVRGIG